MLGERQVAAPLMAQRAAHGARGPAHRRFQPGEGVGVQLAGLRLSGKPQRPSPCQFGHETLVLAFALIAPAASRPGQQCAVRRQRGRQVAPCGHASTVGQRFLRLVPRDDQEERRRTSSPALAGRTPGPSAAVARRIRPWDAATRPWQTSSALSNSTPAWTGPSPAKTKSARRYPAATYPMRTDVGDGRSFKVRLETSCPASALTSWCSTATCSPNPPPRSPWPKVDLTLVDGTVVPARPGT